jgi:hypothetical protein
LSRRLQRAARTAALHPPAAEALARLGVDVHALSADPPARFEIVDGMGGNGDEFAILDTQEQEHLPERYDTREEAQTALHALTAKPRPQVNPHQDGPEDVTPYRRDYRNFERDRS